jgi:hypothetical protein
VVHVITKIHPHQCGCYPIHQGFKQNEIQKKGDFTFSSLAEPFIFTCPWTLVFLVLKPSDLNLDQDLFHWLPLFSYIWDWVGIIPLGLPVFKQQMCGTSRSPYFHEPVFHNRCLSVYLYIFYWYVSLKNLE